jgi:ABC-type antimicrobial peptide transport system permease subunit
MDVMRRAARDLDSDAPIFGIKTVQDTVSGSVAMPRFLVQILGAFALVAVLLAAIGIYGVTSYSVSERSHEIGLRLALGAQTGEVLRLLLKSGLMVASTGVVLGLAGSFATTPLLRRFLYAEIPHEPITIVLVTLLLIAITILATYIPARRVLRVDPVITLRHG